MFQSKHAAFQKHYWSEELNNLKQLSMQTHKAGKERGCLRSGPLNDNRLLCKKGYMLAIREAKQNAFKNIDSKLVGSLIVNDQKSFWKEWNANFKHRVLSRQTVGNKSNSYDNYMYGIC